MLIKYSHLATASIKKQKSAMKLAIQAMNPIIPASIWVEFLVLLTDRVLNPKVLGKFFLKKLGSSISADRLVSNHIVPCSILKLVLIYDQ